jgi:glucose/arabinose dehydrogenase
VCFTPPLFDPIHDVGAFRSQYLPSLAGKIFRIDPDTGLGLPSNPYFTGEPSDVASKVWVYGLRNPFRFALRPNSGTPETLYIGDVGWASFEEINVGHGGENFGWPCYEGFVQQFVFFPANPAHSGCDTIETPENPGPLTPPTIIWHHNVPENSFPPGFTGRCAVGGVFYTGHCYPSEYQGRYLFGDYLLGWIMAMEVDEQDQFVNLMPFASGLGRMVDLEVDPETGDLYYLAILQGKMLRIVHDPKPADADRDCDVDSIDFAAFQSCFRADGTIPIAKCRVFDIDGDNDLDLDDYGGFLDEQTGPL